MQKKLSGIYLVDKDFDNPFENPVEKGLAFTGMDLCLAFGFSRTLPVFPLERFERHEVEIEAVKEFRGVRIFDECNGVLARFGDVGCGKDLTMETT